jgi:hypothetical protein
MQLKSYFSETVEAARELARKELSEEALLVNARPAAPEAGAYEAVFGVVNSALTPEVLESPKPSEALNGRARELASTPAPLNPLLKSLLLKRRAAA